MPGIRSGIFGASDRTRFISAGRVAPTTSPTFFRLFHFFAALITCSYSGFPFTFRCWKSFEPSFDVTARMNAPCSARRVNGSTAS